MSNVTFVIEKESFEKMIKNIKQNEFEECDSIFWVKQHNKNLNKNRYNNLNKKLIYYNNINKKNKIKIIYIKLYSIFYGIYFRIKTFIKYLMKYDYRKEENNYEF